MLGEIVIETAIGLLVMYMAYRTGWQGEVGLLHWYHTQNVMPEKLPAFARRMGQGLMAVGAGCTAMPYVNLLCGADIGYVVGLVLMIGGVAFCIAVLYRYNGSVFGIRKPK
ncbi:MAG: hypothetical protein ACLU9L_08500 [Christensenellales bacterium]